MTETNRSLPPEKSGLTRRPGCALDREFYSSREIFEQDVERIYLRHWLFSGHVSRLARSGDFFSTPWRTSRSSSSASRKRSTHCTMSVDIEARESAAKLREP